MGFLTSLFGGETNYLTMIVALAIVLTLIVLAVWLLKLLGQTTQSIGRTRHKRLVVVDSVPIDQKRQALILRRDDVEHLIVIGGANDLVVETGFEAPSLAAAPPRPVRRPVTAAPPVRPEPQLSAGAGSGNEAGAGKPKSLRHTGLLRTVEEPGSQLPGGKPGGTPVVLPDSDTTMVNAGQEPTFGTVAEAGDSDTADKGTGQRN